MAKKQRLTFKEFQIKETKYFDALDLLRYNKPKKPSRQQAQKALKTVKTIGPQIGRNATKMWSKLEKKYEISIPSIQKPTKRTTRTKRKKKATSRPRKRKNTKKSLIENIGTDFSPRKEAIIKQKMFDHLYGKGVYNIPIPKEKKKPKKKQTIQTKIETPDIQRTQPNKPHRKLEKNEVYNPENVKKGIHGYKGKIKLHTPESITLKYHDRPRWQWKKNYLKHFDELIGKDKKTLIKVYKKSRKHRKHAARRILFGKYNVAASKL